MTSLPNRPNTALLVIDAQLDVVADAHDRDQVIENIRSLVERARTEDVPVVWVQHADDELHADTAAWQLVPELQRADGEALVHKQFGDAFESTSLEDELKSLGVGRIFVAGAQTDACIRSTLHGAFVRGYDTILVSDAHTTEDFSRYGLPPADKVILHTNTYWSWQDGPGRVAGVTPTADVDFSG